MPPEENSPEEIDEIRQVTGSSTAVSIPWLMLVIAALFDLVGLIPFINFFSELVAGFILGIWQKSYAPKTDPFLTFFMAKVADIFTIGLLPSNIAIVIYAYIKKKSQLVSPRSTGRLAIKKS